VPMRWMRRTPRCCGRRAKSWWGRSSDRLRRKIDLIQQMWLRFCFDLLRFKRSFFVFHVRVCLQ
jgi:hypothetical protein